MGLFSRQKPACGAVIVAAGTASRMGGIDKIMTPVGGVPMILRTVRVFETCASVTEIVVVTRHDLLAQVSALCAGDGLKKIRAVVAGGQTRTESVCIGLERLSKECGFAAVHDGARPLVTPELVEAAILRAQKTNAAAPAIAVKDTIKIAADGQVQATPERSTLFAVQTPQVFDIDLLSAALTAAQKRGLRLTDECSAVEALGKRVYLTAGSEENLKITTPVDLALAEAILKWREQP